MYPPFPMSIPFSCCLAAPRHGNLDPCRVMPHPCRAAGALQQPKGSSAMQSLVPHAQEYMFFSLIAQTFTCLLLVLVWLQLKKK